MTTERIDRETFCRTYIPMAKAGKTALEIANRLGVQKPTDAEKSQFVSQKASNYRKELRERALEIAKAKQLNEKDTETLVTETTSKIPRLSKRSSTKSNFVDFLDELLTSCDGDADGDAETEGDAEGNAETEGDAEGDADDNAKTETPE